MRNKTISKKSLIYLFITFLVLSITATTLFAVLRNENQSNSTDSLIINEIAFNQKSGIDWVEIYNPNSINISLQGYYLSDDVDDLTQFEVEKDLVIEAKGFVVIYGNEYEGDETNSTILNFRISEGETLYLTDSDKSVISDLEITESSLSEGNTTQFEEDVTIGSYPDGSSDIYLMTDFTLKESNSIEQIDPIVINYDEIFDPSETKDIHISISDENLEIMSDYEVSMRPGATIDSEDPSYVSADIIIDGVSYEDIAIRYKGNSSLDQSSYKLPYRIDMNMYIDGQTFEGLQEFVLNPNFKDPSQIREILSYQIMRDEGLDAEYATYAKVYVNDEYTGLYTMVENVDDDFLERTYGNSDGLLVKSSNSGTSLKYIDDNIDSYSDSLEFKSGSDKQIDAFIQFLELLNSDVDADYEEEILQYLDAYCVMDYFAMIVVQASMDSYLVSGRNFYIYFDTEDQKYKIIPWDMNETFGTYSGGGGGESTVNWDIYQPTSVTDRTSTNEEKPLFDQLYQVDSFREYYLERIEYYATEVVTLEKLAEYIGLYDSLVYEAEGSSDSTQLRTFINQRSDFVLNQL